jgi:DNA-binding MarR family transcriptional regulator
MNLKTKTPKPAPSVLAVKPAKSGAGSRAKALPDVKPPDQLESSFGYLFRHGNRAFTRALAARLKPHGITLAQWYFLRELWQEEGITQRELSRRMNVSEPTTTVAIDLMEKAGFIDRQRDPEKRNSICVRLTRKGRQLKSRVLHIARDVNANAVRDLDPATLQLIRDSMALMIAALDESADCA